MGRWGAVRPRVGVRRKGTLTEGRWGEREMGRWGERGMGDWGTGGRGEISVAFFEGCQIS
ncbi:MAG: hypothetical protein SW833_05315 [Cyanobacteriota bacterium]|nr:hypothetical protein [Cyanobacteriota bacterium]